MLFPAQARVKGGSNSGKMASSRRFSENVHSEGGYSTGCFRKSIFFRLFENIMRCSPQKNEKRPQKRKKDQRRGDRQLGWGVGFLAQKQSLRRRVDKDVFVPLRIIPVTFLISIILS
ncbi:unnamed protein product [Cochlearia groenlandica]